MRMRVRRRRRRRIPGVYAIRKAVKKRVVKMEAAMV